MLDIDRVDISARHLREKDERLRLATDAAALGVWSWHPETDRIMLENERLHFEGRFRRGAEVRWMELHGMRDRAIDGAPDRIIGTAADVSERKFAAEKLAHLAAALAEADQRKTEFIATLAHELRNPLAPLNNALHLMRLAGNDLDTIARAREVMERQVNHMSRLVDDLLDIARVTSGKIELRMRRLALAGIVEGAVETSRPLIDAAGHRLRVQIPEPSIEVEADAARMVQVVSNLLNNAAKYTPPGGDIDLSVARDSAHATLTVSDNGIGIPAEALSSVFEMFTQLRGETDRSRGGLGIGLCLVRQLVVLHGGAVAVCGLRRVHRVHCGHAVHHPVVVHERRVERGAAASPAIVGVDRGSASRAAAGDNDGRRAGGYRGEGRSSSRRTSPNREARQERRAVRPSIRTARGHSRRGRCGGALLVTGVRRYFTGCEGTAAAHQSLPAPIERTQAEDRE